MNDDLYQKVYQEGYDSYLGDENPYFLEFNPTYYKAWQRGYEDMVTDAMAEDDWPIGGDES